MGLISKFLASKWVTVALIVALGAVAFYIYSQGKMLGGAKEKLDAYEVTITQQQDAIERLARESDAKQKVLQKQADNLDILRKNTRLQQLAVQEARKNANEVLQNCLDMRIADGMRFGPSSENAGSEDQAESGVDG